MSSPVEFTLHFSGTHVFEQQQITQHLLSRVDQRDFAAQTRLHAIVAAASIFTEPEVAQQAASHASIAADKAADIISQAWSLMADCIVDLSCESTPRRLEMTTEILKTAQDSGEAEFVPIAYLLHLAALTELGMVTQLDQALSPVSPLMSQFGWLDSSRQATWFRCLQATLDGRLPDAERLANEAYALALAEADPDAETVLVGQLAIIRWAQGRATDLEPAFLKARQLAPHEPIWAASLAWIWLRQGRRSAARALVESFATIDTLPVDRNWLATACILADVASELGVHSIAKQLHDALVPFSDRLVTIGLGVTCWGTVARPLALTAIALGQHDVAVMYMRQACDVAARTGAHPWLAEAQRELADLLLQTGEEHAAEEASRLAEEAAATARALHLPGVEGLASRTLDMIHPQPPPAALDAQKPRIAVLDEFSVTSSDGIVARWQSRKARALLKILVARRGAPISRETVMDMLWPGTAPHLLANRFSVAATAVRRALDPHSRLPRDAYVEHRDGLIRLKRDLIDIDVETFLASASAALIPTPGIDAATARSRQRDQLSSILERFSGEPMHEDLQEVWAADLRREVHLAFFATAHGLAELLHDDDEHDARLAIYRRLLSYDPYDQRAHEGVIDALTRLGYLGQAEAARNEYRELMASLGVMHSDSV
ncbi:BTAD domain-containing putative transcriptional regulator [Microbacterium sp. NC79]|uniref:BTAD domain-containing putative transcriptional regulator n=1 Tax=Microbacterium sp. NC79 TaxID=2851009 RepID=UPI001C2B9C62|nr:BTAD domain-containing putative transcriptional regulator [Microbacterium sp. NC79]MBV0894580.1 hypothetical protein [Microbacterium sp. NC79]